MLGADQPRYALNYRLVPDQQNTRLEILNSWPGAPPRHYLLTGGGQRTPSGPGSGSQADPLTIRVPVRTAVVLSTTALAHIELLGKTDAVRGIDRLHYVFSPLVRARAQRGQIIEVGEAPALDLERIIAARPDLVLASAVGPDLGILERIQRAGIPVLLLADWMEETALARAEWMRLYGALFGASEAAAVRFAEIETRYNQWRLRVQGVSTRPRVLVNVPYGGRWPMPGGNSYLARLIADAGGDYIWAHVPESGTLFLDIEAVFAAALGADVWVNLGWNWTTRRDVLNADPRFATLRPVQSGQMFNYTRRMIPDGGNDLWESGATRPDLVLADLIKIFHPALALDHELFYYRSLD